MAKAGNKHTTSGPAVEPAKAAAAPPGIVAPDAATPGPGVSQAAPQGRIFIDTAVAEIMARLARPEGAAVKLLMDALRAGETQSWAWGKETGFAHRKLTAEELEGAAIDLDEFTAVRAHRASLVGKTSAPARHRD